MEQLDISKHIQFSDEKFKSVVLSKAPELSLMLLCLQAGQQVPEHRAAGRITVQSVRGHAKFYEGEGVCDLTEGTIVQLEPGKLHRVDAITDAVLLVTLVKTPAGSNEAPEQPPERVIELSPLPRSERHPIVFSAFDELAIDGSFVIVNDHDPQPLRVQLDFLRAGEMSWDYLECGPEVFRIRLTRSAPPAGRVGTVSPGTVESPASIGA